MFKTKCDWQYGFTYFFRRRGEIVCVKKKVLPKTDLAHCCLSRSRTQPQHGQPHDTPLSPAPLPPSHPRRESQTLAQVATAGQSSTVRVSQAYLLSSSVGTSLTPRLRVIPRLPIRVHARYKAVAQCLHCSSNRAAQQQCVSVLRCLGGHKCGSTPAAASAQSSGQP